MDKKLAPFTREQRLTAAGPHSIVRYVESLLADMRQDKVAIKEESLIELLELARMMAPPEDGQARASRNAVAWRWLYVDGSHSMWFDGSGPAAHAWHQHATNVEYAYASLKDQPAAVVPQGWKLVPIEPTETMVVRGFESAPNEHFSPGDVWKAFQAMSGCQQAAFRARLCYAAMLAAAPRYPEIPDRSAPEPVAVGQQEGVHANPGLLKCPITGRPYFMTLKHPVLGMVETFGGPYDSYTVPVLEGEPTDAWHDREMRCERYDHDEGSWVEGGEPVPLRIINEDVLFELEAAAETPPSALDQQAVRDAADAERYRWLKACNGGSIGIVAWHRDEEQEMVLTEERADTAIDAAIRALKSTNGGAA